MATTNQIEAAAKAPVQPASCNRLVESHVLAMPVRRGRSAAQREADEHAESRDAAEVVAGRMLDHPCELDPDRGVVECGHPDHKRDADAIGTALDMLGLVEPLRPAPQLEAEETPVPARREPAARVDGAWAGQGACVGIDFTVFYPPGEPDKDSPEVAAARSICRTCPVQRDCLEYALARPERYGVWGGMTYRERANVARRRQRYAAAVSA